ncbi:hypothetical protein CHUAL_003350 [Chamberlinius hualienensis]
MRIKYLAVSKQNCISFACHSCRWDPSDVRISMTSTSIVPYISWDAGYEVIAVYFMWRRVLGNFGCKAGSCNCPANLPGSNYAITAQDHNLSITNTITLVVVGLFIIIIKVACHMEWQLDLSTRNSQATEILISKQQSTSNKLALENFR